MRKLRRPKTLLKILRQLKTLSRMLRKLKTLLRILRQLKTLSRIQRRLNTVAQQSGQLETFQLDSEDWRLSQIPDMWKIATRLLRRLETVTHVVPLTGDSPTRSLNKYQVDSLNFWNSFTSHNL